MGPNTSLKGVDWVDAFTGGTEGPSEDLDLAPKIKELGTTDVNDPLCRPFAIFSFGHQEVGGAKSKCAHGGSKANGWLGDEAFDTLFAT